MDEEHSLSIYSPVFSRLLKQRKIFLHEEIDKNIATTIQALFIELDSINNDYIEFYINSSGGEAEGFFAIYDTMQMIKSPVRTICIGEASSAAAILLAAGHPGERSATSNSIIMIHQLQMASGEGTATDYEVEAKTIKITERRVTETLARHTGQYYDKVQRDCKFDKYMNSEEAKKYGIIDNIIPYEKSIPNVKRRKRGPRNKKKEKSEKSDDLSKKDKTE